MNLYRLISRLDYSNSETRAYWFCNWTITQTRCFWNHAWLQDILAWVFDFVQLVSLHCSRISLWFPSLCSKSYMIWDSATMVGVSSGSSKISNDYRDGMQLLSQPLDAYLLWIAGIFFQQISAQINPCKHLDPSVPNLMVVNPWWYQSSCRYRLYVEMAVISDRNHRYSSHHEFRPKTN